MSYDWCLKRSVYIVLVRVSLLFFKVLLLSFRGSEVQGRGS